MEKRCLRLTSCLGMLENTISWLRRHGSMDSEAKLYLLRAENEFLMSTTDMKISTDLHVKEFLGIQKEKTFLTLL